MNYIYYILSIFPAKKMKNLNVTRLTMSHVTHLHRPALPCWATAACGLPSRCRKHSLSCRYVRKAQMLQKMWLRLTKNP